MQVILAMRMNELRGHGRPVRRRARRSIAEDWMDRKFTVRGMSGGDTLNGTEDQGRVVEPLRECGSDCQD